MVLVLDVLLNFRTAFPDSDTGELRVISDYHFAVQLNHFTPGFRSYSVAAFPKWPYCPLPEQTMLLQGFPLADGFISSYTAEGCTERPS
jgi:hypothetical protein